jgi:hypothetical protein
MSALDPILLRRLADACARQDLNAQIIASSVMHLVDPYQSVLREGTHVDASFDGTASEGR